MGTLPIKIRQKSIGLNQEYEHVSLHSENYIG